MKTKYYLDILNCIITGKSLSEGTVGNISLQELFWFARLNKMLPLISEYLDKWQPATQEEQNLVADWKTMAMQQVFGEHRKLHLVKQLLVKAEQYGVPLLFFKGYQLAELYKSFALRNSSDTDIYVDEKYLERTVSMLQELRYRAATGLDTKNVYTFVFEENGIQVHKIELHVSLFEDALERERIILEGLHMTTPENTVEVLCCGLRLRTLNYTEHIIYQIFHMAKHLCCHGFPARYLSDTVLFMKRYEKEIDWNAVDSVMTQLGYNGFYVQLLSIFVSNLDLPERFLFGKPLCPEEETGELVRDILWFGARSFEEELSDAFYYFEQYIEKLEARAGRLLEEIRYDGTTVPEKVVPLRYQQSEQLKKRMQLLQNLRLI